MEPLLIKLGFSEPEQRVYLALLEHGGATVTELSKFVQLNRSSVQDYLRKLLSQGFVNVARLGHKDWYQAEDPDKFSQIVHERSFVADRLIPALEALELVDEWQVRLLANTESKSIVRKIERQAEKSKKFGDNQTGGIITNDRTIIWSDDPQVPGLELKSHAISSLHRDLCS